MEEFFLGSGLKFYAFGREQDPVLFLHGFGDSPLRYKSLLEKISVDHLVLAPEAYGMNYLCKQPKSLEEYAELTQDFVSKFPEYDFHLVGHSFGGALAIKLASQDDKYPDLVALNPSLPVNYGVGTHMLRWGHKFFKELMKIEGAEGTGKTPLTKRAAYFGNILKNIPASYQAINSMSKFNYDGIVANQPALVLWAQNDEYYDLNDENRNLLDKVLPNAAFHLIPGKGHVWPIHFPTIVAKDLSNFYSKLSA